jgi:hypothetical protein
MSGGKNFRRPGGGKQRQRRVLLKRAVQRTAFISNNSYWYTRNIRAAENIVKGNLEKK